MATYFAYWIPIVCIVALFNATNAKYVFPFMSRQQWGALPPRGKTPLKLPVDSLHLYHINVPFPCLETPYCVMCMRYLQNLHQLVNGWFDFAYNFAIGGDDVVYEGRGWEIVGAHAAGFNNRSISIAFLSEDTGPLPTSVQITRSKQILSYGLEKKYILSNFTIENEYLWNPKSSKRKQNLKTNRKKIRLHLTMPWF